MPTIAFSLGDLEHLVGRKLTLEKIREYAHYCKGDFEGYDEDNDEVKIDFGDTNMPYLWSVEGFARHIKNLLGINKGVPQIKLKQDYYEIVVEDSVSNVRPFIASFVAKGRKIDDYLLRQLIQLQEKLDINFGRKRQKISIGLYSYKKIKFPVHYKAVVPESVRFVPLDFDAPLDLNEILEQHPKGRQYSWILRGFRRYPLLVDISNEVLSFPPIINSNFTGKVEVGDEDILFEVTGTDEKNILLVTNIFAYAMYDRGFNIYPVTIKRGTEKITTPSLEAETITVTGKDVRRLFGLGLKKGEMKKLLEKAQYSVKGSKVVIPPYRNDIMHVNDVVEDIGIMYGYDKIKPVPLSTFTLGSTSKLIEFVDAVREIMVGLKFQEVISPILSNKNLLYDKMNIKDFGTVEIEEFMSESYSVVRTWILPIMLDVLSKNKHVQYPHKIFEEGVVNSRKQNKILECRRIAIAVSHDKANYTEARQILDRIMKSLGVKYEIEETLHGSFIEGRVGRAVVNGKKVAFLGEISPAVLSNFELEMPVAAIELNLSELFGVVGVLGKGWVCGKVA